MAIAKRPLRVIEKHPRAGLRGVAAMLGWKHHAKVERLVNALIQRKLVKREGRSLLLTSVGQRELNAQESTVSPLSHVISPPLAFPPVPGVRIS
jgi:DNA-binding IclR family transcriptional regulator